MLLIGEHGKYPVNSKAQMQYPRKQFFDATVEVFKRSGRVVPVFCDKHLSYRWDWAKEMVDTARAMKFPLMAGSSVPLAERRPPMELPADARIVEAVSIHGGGVESYDIHALEVLQSIVEARRGGETGVRAVQFMEADALWKAAEAGRWSSDLAAAAMAAETGPDHELVRYLKSRGKSSNRRARADPRNSHRLSRRHAWRGAEGGQQRHSLELRLPVSRARISRWPRCSTSDPGRIAISSRPCRMRFKTHFRQGHAPYPIERTLLTTGILDAAMDSRVAGVGRVETPQLEFAYAPQDYRAMREMGATWKIITDKTPEPPGIEPVAIQ